MFDTPNMTLTLLLPEKDIEGISFAAAVEKFQKSGETFAVIWAERNNKHRRNPGRAGVLRYLYRLETGKVHVAEKKLMGYHLQNLRLAKPERV